MLPDGRVGIPLQSREGWVSYRITGATPGAASATRLEEWLRWPKAPTMVSREVENLTLYEEITHDGVQGTVRALRDIHKGVEVIIEDRKGKKHIFTLQAYTKVKVLKRRG
jgi:hypothetical protein